MPPVDNFKISAPFPPSMTSLFESPAAAMIIMSAPLPALIMSAPDPPVIWSIFPLPVMVKASDCPLRMTVDPEA